MVFILIQILQTTFNLQKDHKVEELQKLMKVLQRAFILNTKFPVKIRDIEKIKNKEFHWD